MTSRLNIFSIAALLAVCAVVQPLPVRAAAYGEVSVLAQVPIPNGFPEGIAVRGNRFYVAGPATLGTAFNGKPSRVFEYDVASGALLRTLETQGEQVFGAEHANSCLSFDGAGRLYVLNNQLGTFRLDLATSVQAQYTPAYPDLKSCSILNRAPCSPTVPNLPALPNDLAFDDAGNLYVTDSLQATIWKVPPGGGRPQVWFQDSRLASPYVGVNGLRLSPDRSRLFFTVTLDFLGIGHVYSLPLVSKPKASDLREFRRYLAGGPDGIAFGASGRLYVVLALPGQSGISVLNPDGSEFARIGNPGLNLIKPFDSPANLAFDGLGNALVTNHAFATGLLLPNQFQVLKVFVNDTASPLAEPLVP
ncbi:SMP-30/gluconolactonase/LRE family protein [Nevskia sp.]|uniref:SMP-30/gluconolactonase/LRE family protein n=1 Tax=Nevskia sp. TaxID=1929292 RepID=UPI003F6EDBA8